MSLELALAGVPLIACYKLDWLAKRLSFLLTTWSASLPNLISDRITIAEYYNEQVRPGHLARDIEGLLHDTPIRRWQLDGFDEVRRRLSTDRPSGDIAAEVVMQKMGSAAVGQ